MKDLLSTFEKLKLVKGKKKKIYIYIYIYCLFILFMGLSGQEYWSCLPFPSPVLSELSTMTCPSWVALHRMAHGFIDLDKAVVHVISLVGHHCGVGEDS